MSLTILAKITAMSGKEDFVRDALRGLIAPTLAETGCITYDLHEDNDTPGVFVFYETWETRELWQDHMKAPHLAAHSKATEGTVKSVELNEMTRLD